MTMNKKNIPLLKSFWCATKGLISCFKTERNFRIHLCACFYVVWFSGFYSFGTTQKAVIALTIGFVIVSELLNTAIETAVDLASPQHNKLAGLAKDIAAGGVLASAITAVVVAVIFFADIKIIKKIADFYHDNTSELVVLIVSIIIWFGIVFLPDLLKKKKD